MLDRDVVQRTNESLETPHRRDLDALGEQLGRRGVDTGAVLARLARFQVAIPSWALGTGGTRFGRFPGDGEPRDVYEKMDDVAVIHDLTRAAPRVSLHVPWDEPDDPGRLREHAAGLGLGFDAVNSNTFQDQAGRPLSYKADRDGLVGQLDDPQHAMSRRAFVQAALIGSLSGSLLAACEDGTESVNHTSNVNQTSNRSLSEKLVIGVEEGPDEYLFGRILGAVIDHNGNTHIGDLLAHEVKVYNPLGEFLFRYGRSGEGPGEFRGLDTIKLGPDGHIYVNDPSGGNISQFTPEGEYVTRCTYASVVAWMKDFVVLNDGNIAIHGYLTDEMATNEMPTHAFSVFGMDGVLKDRIGRYPANEGMDAFFADADLGGVNYFDAATLLLANDMASDRILAASEYAPNRILAYQMGQDEPTVLVTDASMTGTIRSGPRDENRPFDGSGIRTSRGQVVGLFSDQEAFGYLCTADGLAFMLINDNITGELSLRGYDLASGARVLYAAREFDTDVVITQLDGTKTPSRSPPARRKLLTASDGPDGPMLVSARKNPYPALFIERVEK